MDPPPAKRLAQVADVAKAISKMLLPDDDDCRDLLDGDNQFESDMEPFEHFTGTMIEAGDDNPILREEVEMEDTERSL